MEDPRDALTAFGILRWNMLFSSSWQTRNEYGGPCRSPTSCMPAIAQVFLNLNACRITTATAVMILASSGSPLWWTVAIPWFFLNLPGLLLFTFPALTLLFGLTGSQPVNWLGGISPLFLSIALPTAISMVLSFCWRPIFRRTGVLGQFYYPGS